MQKLQLSLSCTAVRCGAGAPLSTLELSHLEISDSCQQSGPGRKVAEYLEPWRYLRHSHCRGDADMAS